MDHKQYAEAEPLIRECLAIRERVLPDDWRTFNTKAQPARRPDFGLTQAPKPEVNGA